MITQRELIVLRDKYINNKENVIRERMLRKTKLVDLITDNNLNKEEEFNYVVKTHGVTNQYSSGRCWIFGGLNIIREDIIKNCNLNNYELSESYLSFYDKLEKFNYAIEKIIKLIKEGKDDYDSDLSSILKTGIVDGGNFSNFISLVKKYGIVPKDVYQESYQSSNTSEINQILTRLIKKFYLEIINNKKIDRIKNKYMTYAYKVLSNTYGLIVDKFDFEYIDKNGKYHLDKNLTPKKFYNKYVKINILDYIEIYSFTDEKYALYNYYELEDTSNIVGVGDNHILNIPINDMKNLILKQIKNNEPVYFSTSTTSDYIDGIWIDIYKRYGEIFDIDLVLNNNEIIKTNETTGEHVMVFTGVKLINNKPVLWKIENSWGDTQGNNGYFIGTDDFVNKYVFNVVINKKYLTSKQKKVLEKKIIKIKKEYSKY